MKQTKIKNIWGKIFPGFSASASGPDNSLADPLPINAFYEDFFGVPGDPSAITSPQGEDDQPVGVLPINRLARYPVFQAMAYDPTIDSAIKMHLSHSLSAKSDTGEIVSIESTSKKDDPITIDLRNTFKEIINKNCMSWAFNAALYGIWFCRVYGQPGKGVELIRSDYYTHPQFMRMYERAGQLVGYSSAWQRNFERGQISLLPPWSFVPFRIPYWKIETNTEPFRADGRDFDIANNEYQDEGICESQNYGQSLIETAFGPWLDLQEAIISLNMSRKNAARLERLIGVNTGKMSPQKAAQYLGTISGLLLKTQRQRAAQSLKRGFIQTIINHLVPIWGDGKGRLEINTIEGNPNIEGLADVQFHVNRLGSALGIDPSLLGFGELLSGGLGDGGFFRVSVLAAIRANLLRRAIATGLETMFDIHVAYKFNKIFLPGEKPWRLMFNSVSSALDREEQENREGRANLASLIGTIVQTLDPELQSVDRQAFYNFLWTDIMKVDEEKFKGMFPGKKIEGQEPLGGGMPEEDDGDGDQQEPKPETPVFNKPKPLVKKTDDDDKGVMESALVQAVLHDLRKG